MFNEQGNDAYSSEPEQLAFVEIAHPGVDDVVVSVREIFVESSVEIFECVGKEVMALSAISTAVMLIHWQCLAKFE